MSSSFFLDEKGPKNHGFMHFLTLLETKIPKQKKLTIAYFVAHGVIAYLAVVVVLLVCISSYTFLFLTEFRFPTAKMHKAVK